MWCGQSDSIALSSRFEGRQPRLLRLEANFNTGPQNEHLGLQVVEYPSQLWYSSGNSLRRTIVGNFCGVASGQWAKQLRCFKWYQIRRKPLGTSQNNHEILPTCSVRNSVSTEPAIKGLWAESRVWATWIDPRYQRMLSSKGIPHGKG